MLKEGFIKVNESIGKTYSYLKGNFSEDSFLGAVSTASFDVLEMNNVSFNESKPSYDETNNICKTINNGVNDELILNLQEGKKINFNLDGNCSIKISNELKGEGCTFFYNLNNNKENSNIYFTSEVLGDGKEFNLLYNISVSKYSTATIVIFLNSSTKGFINILSNIEEGSKLDIILVNLNRENTYINSQVFLNGLRCKSNFYAPYICFSDVIFDYNVTQSLIGVESEGNIISKGVLLNNSKKIFRGAIDFRKGCTNAIGCESEEAIILGSMVKNQSLPLLLCKEKNVKGSHGFTANSIDENKLFYLLSRGFSDKEARSLILQGKFSNLLKEIKEDNILSEFLAVLKEEI